MGHKKAEMGKNPIFREENGQVQHRTDLEGKSGDWGRRLSFLSWKVKKKRIMLCYFWITDNRERQLLY